MSLLDTASLIVTPNGYKEGTLYSVIPSDGSGDMSVVRATTATRVNSTGLIESVANNIPRLDYSNGTCPSLLVEPQRTNLALYSSSFDNAAWVKDNNGAGTLPVVTANSAISPDGTQNADRIQFSNVGGSGSSANYSIIVQSVSLPATGTLSIYLKSNTSSNQNILVYWGGGQGQVFSVTPEWQRFTLFNLGATTTAIVIGARGGSGSFFNGGDEVLDILFYGAQLEAGSYPTSYIPTTTASVTRNADLVSKTGISSLIGQTEGTLFSDFFIDNILNGGNFNAFLIRSDYDNIVQVVYYADGTIQFLVITSGVLQVNISASSYLTAGHHKFAVTYKNNDFAFYVDGNLIGTDLSGIVPNTSILDLTEMSGAKQRYNSFAIWKTRLTNTQLAQLTTI